MLNQHIANLFLAEIGITNNDKDAVHVKGVTFPGYAFTHIPRRGNHG